MDLRQAIQLVKERLSIVELVSRYVELKPKGRNLAGPCPFHQETKPSFFVNPDRGSFHCFGCQASGDVLEFYTRITGMEFREAISQLAEELGITIDSWQKETGRKPSIKRDATQMHMDATRHFRACLARPAGQECRDYIEQRGLSPQIIERFELGFSERSWNSLLRHLETCSHDLAIAHEAGLLAKSERGTYYDRFRGRLMFPIKNLSNQIIAFGGRIINADEEAKYINTADTPIYSKKEHLYGLAQARRAIVTSGSALLTEGYMDVLTLHQFGFENSVGVLGTALTTQQIQRLTGFTAKIELLFDGDRAGRAAALRSAEMLLSYGISCRVILLPEGEDIDSLLRSNGPKYFEQLRQNAPEGLAYCLSQARELAPRDAIAWAKHFLDKMQVPELVSPYASRIAPVLGIAEAEFRAGLSHAPPVARHSPTANLLERDTQIMLFAVRYPERLGELREIGADLALTSQRSRIFWQIIEEHGADAVYYLDERQKAFWQKQRSPEAPPCTNGDLELQCLKQSLDRFYAHSQLAALEAAMNAGPGHELDLQYMHAMRDAMRKDNE